jgi:hypothetical protein
LQGRAVDRVLALEAGQAEHYRCAVDEDDAAGGGNRHQCASRIARADGPGMRLGDARAASD